jgi:hypothetical protein
MSVINPKTGRTITTNGAAYKKLLKEGYVFDGGQLVPQDKVSSTYQVMNLPELIIYIMEYLGFTTLITLRRINKSYRSLAEQQLIRPFEFSSNDRFSVGRAKQKRFVEYLLANESTALFTLKTILISTSNELRERLASSVLIDSRLSRDPKLGLAAIRYANEITLSFIDYRKSPGLLMIAAKRGLGIASAIILAESLKVSETDWTMLMGLMEIAAPRLPHKWKRMKRKEIVEHFKEGIDEGSLSHRLLNVRH